MRWPKKRKDATARNSLALSQCLAKTYDEKTKGRRVLNHCHIVGEVAKELISRLPKFLRESLFPAGSELIAAAHDWGKISPTFQEKIYRGCEGYVDNSIDELVGIDPRIEKNWGGHAGVSMATAKALDVGKYIPEILGQHHGFMPNLGGKLAEDGCFGGTSWLNRRREYFVELKKLLNCDFPKVKDPLHASVLSGLTTVSDWIGSGKDFDDPSQDWRPLISQSLDSAGFVKPVLKKDQSFEDIFDFKDTKPIQQALIRSCNTPGVYVMEAPMGIGKTEAALYAAYQVMAKDLATGIYFALPTQFTSEKVHERVIEFLEKILADDCPHRKPLLLHGNAWLKQTQMGEEGKPGGSWFQSSKRGILAPFGVGTIDQALMAVMNVKHGFVRTFGLAGKVVILDEVHSYDAYTGTLLDELVSALRKLQCTVIVLSATLTIERRSELLGTKTEKDAYPLVSASPQGGNLQEFEVTVLPNDLVHLSWVEQKEEVIDGALRRACEGQQVLWIENTVTEAQDVYSLLAARTHEMDVACGILHSRFTQTDRDRKERHWVELFGKDGKQKRIAKGRILVGTQVLEQSLDIDADYMITRFCPTDMLLQRFGRLWRHSETKRASNARREAWIIAPNLDVTIENPEKAFGKTAFVYNPYVLCRSLEVWRDKRSVSIPENIRGLIESTYQERDEQNQMATWKNELFKGKGNHGKRRIGIEAMKSLAQAGISKAGTTLSENKSATRYGEQESVQVLLLRNILHPKGSVELTFLDGNRLTLKTDIKTKDRNEWRKFAVSIMKQIVNVPQHHAPAAVPRNSIHWLSHYLYLGNKDYEESLVRVALVEKNGELKLPGGGAVSDKYDLKYSEHVGYQVCRSLDPI